MIRSFRLRDSLLVQKLQQVGTPLDTEELLTQPRNPLYSAIYEKLFQPRADSSTFLFDQKSDSTRTLGLAQLRSRPGYKARDVVFLSPSLEKGNGVYAVWQRLLSHLCVQTAESGGSRVFVSLPAEGREINLFKTVGFTDYSQEDVFQLSSADNTTPWTPFISLRVQRDGDGWGLQKLYALLTPRPIQNVEGSAQGQWALSTRRWGEPGERNSYIWEIDDEIVGAIQLRRGQRGIWIRTLLHPHYQEQAEPFLKTALSLTKPYTSLPVYFVQRQYESGWINLLPTLGFKPFSTHILTVKHMTVQVRNTIPSTLSSLKESSVVGGQSSVVSSHHIGIKGQPET